jgi:outer membrane protein assembly factor BamA
VTFSSLWRRGLLATLLLALAHGARAEPFLIEEIALQGNDKTKRRTIVQELFFTEGERVSERDIERSRQAVMDLGLFKSVHTSLEEMEQGHRLIIRVNEKRYWLVLPKLSRSGDGDWAYGAQLKVDNLGGLNQELDLSYRRKDLKDADVEQEDRLKFEYNVPRIFGSFFDVNLDARMEQREIDEERDGAEGQYDQQRDFLRLTISRWLRDKGPSRGWFLSGGLQIEDYEHEYLGGDPTLYFDTRVVTFRGAIRNRDVRDLLYNRRGRDFGYEINLATDTLESERSFVRHFLYYRRYREITPRQYTNLNYQLRLGVCTASIFGEPCYSLGGSKSLRGHSRDSVEGDAFVIGNVEALTPVFDHRSLRAVVFADIGDAEESLSDLNFSDLNYSVGFGLRWKLKSFVRTDLRIDFARGFGDDGESKVYASTDNTF